jgi:flavin reductase (DIM6/NTAB) family NADH-FMN oxidoreductase RutF
MAKVVSEGIGAFYQHHPNIACVVTAHSAGKNNAMAVGWHMPISFTPPLYGIAISPKRFTYQLIADSKEFGVNFLPFEAAELVASVGGSKGGETDKFRRFNIRRDKPLKTRVPVLKDAYAAYECRLVDDRSYGDHQLLVGEIIAVHMLPEAFTVDETLNLARVSPVLYLGHELYVTASAGMVKSLDRKLYGNR